ncbi:unnamed protein product [Adineta steineri]|uniref:Uncharacterized protein n=1 Tax=Adineta steineri TaxID=433720 RepID=A0A814R6E1_9BILA|nr:unnamed protein product [Adineta steineri]CAF3626956.1 unnamed protein product [Adineta steineri]
MGTILRCICIFVCHSSNKDYNRALAKQPRKSIGLSKFEVSNIQQQPLIGTLSIPYPVRISQSNDKLPDPIDEPPPQIEIQPTINERIPSPKPSPTIDNQQHQQQEKLSVIENSSRTPSPNLPAYNQTMTSEPTIIRRSIIDLNKHRRLNNNQLTSYPPNRSVIERNGKQFLTELRERLERRYVQIFDESTGQMRLFEVTDYIPTRTVKSVTNSPQLSLHRNAIRNSFSPRSSSFNQHSSARNKLNNPIQTTTTPSNLVDFNDLNNRETVAREFDLYHSGADLPFNRNNNTNLLSPSQPRSKHRDSIYSTSSQFQPSQPKGYNSSTITSQGEPNQYSPSSYRSQPQSFRPHSPTASDYSVSTSSAQSISDSSDLESINRVLTPTHHRSRHNPNSTSISYGTVGEYNSSAELDPFAKTVRPSEHTYQQRSGANNYSEPIARKPGFGRTGVSDYAPLPVSYNQTSRDRRKESNPYDG